MPSSVMIEIPDEFIDQIANAVIDKILSNIKSEDRYMTLQEAAKYVKRSTRYLQDRKEIIGYHKEGKELTFKKSDLDRFMESIYHRPQPE